MDRGLARAIRLPMPSAGDCQPGRLGDTEPDAVYGPLERAHITALLATGFDLGYLADPNNPDVSYSAQDLQSEPLASIISANMATTMDLDSTVTAVRRDANNNIGLAVNFISMTPYAFAMEGN